MKKQKRNILFYPTQESLSFPLENDKAHTLFLEVKNLNYSLKGRTLLQNIHFQWNHQECIGVIGLNGAGKTTLMNILAQNIFQQSGEVAIHLHTQEQIQNFQWENGLYYTGDGFLQFPHLSVSSLLKMHFYLFHSPDKKHMALEKMLIQKDKWELNSIWNQAYETLSLGEKQRVNLACALIGNPYALLLDEPFQGMDPIVNKLFRSCILELKQKHPIMMSAHQLSDLLPLVDSLLILHSGEVIYTGSIQDFIKTFHHSSTSLNQQEFLSQQSLSELIEEVLGKQLKK